MTDEENRKALEDDSEWMEKFRTSQNNSFSLGLDLQGGVHLLWEVETEELIVRPAMFSAHPYPPLKSKPALAILAPGSEPPTPVCENVSTAIIHSLWFSAATFRFSSS